MASSTSNDKFTLKQLKDHPEIKIKCDPHSSLAPLEQIMPDLTCTNVGDAWYYLEEGYHHCMVEPDEDVWHYRVKVLSKEEVAMWEKFFPITKRADDSVSKYSTCYPTLDVTPYGKYLHHYFELDDNELSEIQVAKEGSEEAKELIALGKSYHDECGEGKCVYQQ